MRVLITGSSGLIGPVLGSRLTRAGHDVIRLVRRVPGKGEIRWDPLGGSIDRAGLEGADAVVHLAGENVGDGRWTEAKMRRIRESREKGTSLLSEALAGLERKPSVLVSASAIGYYGNRGEELLNEYAPSGNGFLPQVCELWEGATRPARDAGIRVVHPRIGVVLSPDGGALARMLTPFRFGLGGPLGDGRQWFSWISLEDQVRVLERAIEDSSLAGPVNSVAPGSVRFAEFARTLGRVLSRPAFAPMPAFAARMAFGRMADELLLASIRVEPRALTEAGFEFTHPTLEDALRALLRKAA
jgi:uncharacterized protein (TIGR01777 family)